MPNKQIPSLLIDTEVKIGEDRYFTRPSWNNEEGWKFLGTYYRTLIKSYTVIERDEKLAESLMFDLKSFFFGDSVPFRFGFLLLGIISSELYLSVKFCAAKKEAHTAYLRYICIRDHADEREEYWLGMHRERRAVNYCSLVFCAFT